MRKRLKELFHLIVLTAIAYIFSYFLPLLTELPYNSAIGAHLGHLDLRIYTAILILEGAIVWSFWDYIINLANRIVNTCTLEAGISNSFDDIFFVATGTIYLLCDFGTPGHFASFILFPNALGALLFYTYRLTLYRNAKTCKIAPQGSEFKDEPIDSEDKDLLGRGSFIQKLYTMIVNLPFSDPYIMALNAGWGDGKTSAVNLLKNRIENNPRSIVVDFDPWYFRDEKEIIKSFFQSFESTVSDKYWMGNLRTLFSNYLKITGFSGLGIHFDFSGDSLKHIQEGIQNAINRLGKDVIIFIDDIDRLEAKEMLVVFKLVRLMAKFQRLRFVLIFDAKRVSAVLAEKYSDFVPEYLEKIIQQPIQLPLVEQRCLDGFFDNSLSALFSRLGITEATEKDFFSEFPLIYQMHLKHTLSNIRQIKRYLNSLNFTLPMIQDEVSILDFLLLDFLRIFYPKVFDDVQQNPHIYQHIEWGENSFLYYGGGYKQDRKAIIKTHVEELLSKEQDKAAIKTILEKMFFDVQYAFYGVMTSSFSDASYRTAKRISHPDCFYKYFALQVATSELPDSQIEEIILSWNDATSNREELIKQTFARFQENKQQSQFLDRLRDFKTSLNHDTIIALIEYIHKYAKSFSAKRDGTISLSDHSKVLFLMLGFINDMEDVVTILEKVITNTPDMSLMVGIVLSCKEERGGDWHRIYNEIEIDKLKKIATDRLKQHYADENRNVFDEYPDDWSLILYQWGTNWGESQHTNRKIVGDYVLKTLKANPKQFVEFIKAQPQKRNTSGELKYSIEEFSAIYHYESFLAYAKAYLDKPELSEGEKVILRAFIASYP